MNLKEKVLIKDSDEARRLQAMIHHCLGMHKYHVNFGDKEIARQWMGAYEQAKSDLDKLYEKKREDDRVRYLVNDLKKRFGTDSGVNVIYIEKVVLGSE